MYKFKLNIIGSRGLCDCAQTTSVSNLVSSPRYQQMHRTIQSARGKVFVARGLWEVMAQYM
jgi:hypothetical protein